MEKVSWNLEDLWQLHFVSVLYHKNKLDTEKGTDIPVSMKI